MHWAVKVGRDSALELVVFNAIAAGIALGALFILGADLLPAFGFVVLLESVALMLIGGAMDLSTTGSIRIVTRQFKMIFRGSVAEKPEEQTAEERRKIGVSAATYAVTGVLLFVEAGMLTLLFV
ncbi:MAG: hypothetical protein OK438_04115 [Thaumarchaeota archaeon]|nr:hypothetical protein [Nitrososphaerota archaeon]